jgi:hypothetical protein
MRTGIDRLQGLYAWARFYPESQQEKDLLTALSLSYGRVDDTVEMNAFTWVEQALRREGYGSYSVVSFELVLNNLYYVFRVQRIGSLGGW